MSALVLAALAALGPAATWGEIERVAAALNASGDPEALGVFEAADWTVHGRQGSRAGWARLNALAEQAGAGGFTALDLCCEVRNLRALRRTLTRHRPDAGDMTKRKEPPMSASRRSPSSFR